MRKILLLLLLSCMLARAEDPKETSKTKVREIQPDTGCPIYEEGEVIPPGVSAHVRRKDGTFLSDDARRVVQITITTTPIKEDPKIVEPVAEPAKPEKAGPLSICIIKPEDKALSKTREIQPDTHCPIYEEGEVIPPGISVHIRRKDGTFLSTGASAVVEIRNSPLNAHIVYRKQFT